MASGRDSTVTARRDHRMELSILEIRLRPLRDRVNVRMTFGDHSAIRKSRFQRNHAVGA